METDVDSLLETLHFLRIRKENVKKDRQQILPDGNLRKFMPSLEEL